jgi:hypothetical protein
MRCIQRCLKVVKILKDQNLFHSNSERRPSPPVSASRGARRHLLGGKDKIYDDRFSLRRLLKLWFHGMWPCTHTYQRFGGCWCFHLQSIHVDRHECIGVSGCLHIQRRTVLIQTFRRNLPFPIFYIYDGGRMLLGKFG